MSDDNQFEIVLFDGSVLIANIYKQWFEAMEIDIALLELDKSDAVFSNYLPILERPIYLHWKKVSMG